MTFVPRPTETPWPTGLTAGEREMLATAQADAMLLVLLFLFFIALLFGALMLVVVRE